MKKYLLGTTALVGASVMASGAMAMPIQSKSEAGVPILTASMVAQFEGGIADNDQSFATQNTRDGGFVNGRFAEIFFNGELTADNGLVYGAKVHLATGNQDVNGNTHGYPGREYIYLSGGWGSMEFGNWIGADSGLNLCLTCNTYAGYGGLDTPWRSYVALPAGYHVQSVNSFWFDQSAKVTYYTPVIAGFQAGVSYTPSTKPFFGPAVTTADNDGNFKDVIGFGAQFNHDFGGLGIAISGVGAVGDRTRTAGTSGFTATTGSSNMVGEMTGIGYYEIGAVARYAGFQFGGSWFDEAQGGGIGQTDFGRERHGWTLDAAYKFGPYGIEVQYANATIESSARLLAIGPGGIANMVGMGVGATGISPSLYTEEFESEMWAVSFGYAVAPGLKWYAEVIGASFEHSPSSQLVAWCASAAGIAAGCSPSAVNPGSALENDAIAFVSGLVLSF